MRLIRLAQGCRSRDRDEAAATLLRHFRPLLLSQVRRFSGRGVEEADLLQTASVGFMHAVERFDLCRSTRLSSYARPWVEGALRREVHRHGATITLPDRVSRDRAKFSACRDRLAEEFGRDPSADEIAVVLGFASEKVNELMLIPRVTSSLSDLVNEETLSAGTAVDAEDELGDSTYSQGEVVSLVELYQELRSLSEVRPSSVGEPRLRRRSGGLVDLVRLIDLDCSGACRGAAVRSARARGSARPAFAGA